MSSPHDGSEPCRSIQRDDWPEFAIECIVERSDGSDRCTLHPRDATSEELLDTWISATEGSFVSVTRTR